MSLYFGRIPSTATELVALEHLKTTLSVTFINDPFLSFVFRNDWLQNHCWLSTKSMSPNSVVVVIVSLSNMLSYWIGYTISARFCR